MEDSFDERKWRNRYLLKEDTPDNIDSTPPTFTIEDMEEAYNHAMMALAGNGHGEGFEEYMDNKFNI